jgi:endonuclease-3
MTADTTGGIYTLAIALAEPTTIDVGALGPITFDRGWYAYTGSAHGPGGFARVTRHRELADGERERRHWHVDYLLAAEASTLCGVGQTPASDRECATARALPGTPVPAFGASDCECQSHLRALADRTRLASALADRHESVDVFANPR